MPLNPPTVGRLSECSQTVVVSQQLPGSTVTLYHNTRDLPPYHAKTVWEVFTLPPTVTLTRDDRVVATQSLGGETSPPSIHSIVQGAGPAPSSPQVGAHIYQCAHHVLLTGMTPGTLVEVWDGTINLGSAVAHEGAAIVALSEGVPSNAQLEARAHVCGHAPVLTTLPPSTPLPFHSTGRVPAPWFGTAPMDCVEWIRIDGVYPGATVVLERGDGSWQSWGFCTASWLVQLTSPLQDGEPLSLRQEFPRCELTPDEYRTTVGPLRLATPGLSSAWCTGRVNAHSLQPGATVVFFDENGSELGRSGAPDAWAQFTLHQPHSLKIGARQELCGQVSPNSNLVDSQIPSQPPQPEIIGPVFECQTSVLVHGQSPPGGEIEIWSHQRGRIGHRWGMGKEARIKVTGLVAGEVLQAHAVTCDGKDAMSPDEPVGGFGDLQLPVIQGPVYEGDQVIRVSDLVADALVSVTVNGVFATSIQATGVRAEVNLPRALSVGDEVEARSTFCSQTRESHVATAQPRPSPPPQQMPGYSQVKVYNCHTSHHPLEVWVLDYTAGTTSHVASLDHQYDEWGTCPVEGDPVEVDLDDGHAYEIIMVDVGGDLCGVNDPMVAGCRRQVVTVLGSTNGPALPVIVA